MSPFGMPFNMFNIMFAIVPIFVGLGFVLVFGLIISSAIRGARQWNKNNHSPVLTVEATVVSKRMDVSHHHHNHGNDMGSHYSHSSTFYYATFQFESGDRMELAVPDQEYGYLIEGDMGKLTFQGTRYLGFKRG